MRITIDSEVLNTAGISIKEFSVILYYIGGGKDILNKELCEDLHDKGYLMEIPEGYKIHPGKRGKIQHLTSISSCKQDTRDRLTPLADKLRELFPTGRKEGTNNYWRDSTNVISSRLASFFKKYGESYTDEQIVQATDNYIKSFNGNYKYMQLLKYFIFKKGTDGEENSQLASYLQNIGQESIDNDWTANIV